MYHSGVFIDTHHLRRQGQHCYSSHQFGFLSGRKRRIGSNRDLGRHSQRVSEVSQLLRDTWSSLRKER
uniref:Uncharacterized protein n=1 Tax=Lepeophtheirus salmonis TaxID=72036 RepID=A0A0K2U9N8_LEPSM